MDSYLWGDIYARLSDMEPLKTATTTLIPGQKQGRVALDQLAWSLYELIIVSLCRQ
jgi:hypothetical protein